MQALIRFLQWAVRNHPKKIVALHALLMVIGWAIAAQGLRIDTSVDGLMTSDDPDVIATQELKREFANDEVTIVAVELGRVFNRDDLQRLARITDRLAEVPAIEEVLSLTNVEDVRGDGAGGLDASPLLGADRLAELDDAGLVALRERIAAHPLYPTYLVSRGLDVLAVIISFEPPEPGKGNIRAATAEIQRIVSEESAGWAPMWVTGYPILEREADSLVKSDLLVLSPIVFLVLLLIFYGIARRLFSVILLCTLSLWTTTIAVVYFALTDTPMNIVTSSVPPILLTTSSVYGIFLLGLLQTLQNIKDPAMTVIDVATRPSFLSMTSTVIGFLSMLFIHVDALQEMGVGLAIGTFGSFIATLSLLPALIQLMEFRAPPVHWQWVDRFATVGVRLARHPWRVIAGVSLLVAASVPGLAALHVETNPLDYFRATSTTIRAHDFVRDHLGGAILVNLVVRTGRPDGALDPQVTSLVETLVQEAERDPTVHGTLSLLDYNALMDKALRPEEHGAGRRVLPTAEAAAQYLLLYEMGGDPGDLKPYINHDRSALSIRLRIKAPGARGGLALEKRLRAVADAHPEVKAEVRLLGSAFMFARSADSISAGLIPGFGATIIVVLLTFWFTLRSLKLALIAIPPNVLPYLFCMALMGYADIPISIGTSLVGFIAIGLAVDDTAHLLSHLQGGHPMPQVYSEVGMPVLLTSMSLGIGFLVLVASGFQVIAVFGLATGITLGSAVLGDIVLLPSILRLLGYSLEGGTEVAGEDAHEPALAPAGEAG